MSHASLDASVPPPTAEIAHPPLLPVSADGATHLPVASQIVGATQSLTDVQAVRQVPSLLHLYVAQSVFVPFEAVVM